VALTAERLKRLGPLPLRGDQQRTLLGADDDPASRELRRPAKDNLEIPGRDS
jgi:hypothetical protein